MANSNARFAEMVTDALQQEGFSFDVEPSVAGLTPDLVVNLSNGQQVLIEAKGWSDTPASIERAVKQVDYYRDQLNAYASFVVMPSVAEEVPNGAVVGLPRLVEHLHGLERWRRKAAAPSPEVEASKPILFCAMPFSSSFDDTFFVAMRGAAAANGMSARRVDQDEFAHDIVVQIHETIENSTLVVADLSGARPNVLYEAGYARGLQKPIIYISSTSSDELPFDVAHDNTLFYGVGQTSQLLDRLTKRVAAVQAEPR